MAEIDWQARAEVQRRDDGGSDMYVDFRTLKSGPLSEMVRWAMDLPSEDRARVIIEAKGVGSINIYDIAALARRDDFPAA